MKSIQLILQLIAKTKKIKKGNAFNLRSGIRKGEQ